jgi:outer membrane protein assembly factor BamB
MKPAWTLFLCLISAAVAVYAEDNADHWPQWRGPHANGIAAATELPATWSRSENVIWATPLPAWAGSTPVVWGDRIYLISPSKSEPKPEGETEKAEDETSSRRGRMRGPRSDPGGSELMLIALSRKDGSVLWQQQLDSGNRLFLKDNAASPSPVTDGRHVWAITGTGVVTAFDVDGKKIWSRDLQEEFGPFGLNFGYASSPLHHDGKLIVQVLHGTKTDDPSYLIALDARTGETLWRHERETDALAESPRT